MAFISTLFSYNGIRSDQMGISLVHMESGPLLQSQFWGDIEIISELIPGNNTPYIYGQRINPLRVKLTLSPLDGYWTSELKSAVTRWLNNGKFNEFYSTDDIDRIYYLAYVGSSELHETGNKQGYIDVEFQNIDCYVRSPVMEKNFHLQNLGNNSTIIELEVKGDEKIYPKIFIQKIGAGDIEIKNLSYGEGTFRLNNLYDNEIVIVDGKNRTIESNIPDRLLYDNFSGYYLKFAPNILGDGSVQRLRITGACKLKFVYRYLWKST